MKTMTTAVLDELRETCEENQNYQACIFCEDNARAAQIQEVLINAWPVREDQYFGGCKAVIFPSTRSVVRIMTSDELRDPMSYTCCEVIADSAVYVTERARRRLNRLIVPSIYDNREEVQDLGELDSSPEILEYIRGEYGSTRSDDA